MKRFITNFLSDESGATAIEYGLLASLIALAIIIGATLVGTTLNTLFKDISACLDGVAATECKFD